MEKKDASPGLLVQLKDEHVPKINGRPVKGSARISEVNGSKAILNFKLYEGDTISLNKLERLPTCPK